MKGKRRLLQLCVFLAAGVPVAAGGFGVVGGASVFDATVPPDADNHIRYLFGVLFGIGLAYWFAIPRIEKHTALFNVLTFVVVCGGTSRLIAMLITGFADKSALLALTNEIIVAPLLWLWQRRIACIAA